MEAKIRVRVRTMGRIGCTDEEREHPQPLIVSVVCTKYLARVENLNSIYSDGMLDYDHVKHVVEVHVDARKSLTLESLAYDIAHDVLMLKPGEISVVVDIRKPSFQAGVSLAVSIEDLEARRNMLEVLESRRESTKEKKGG